MLFNGNGCKPGAITIDVEEYFQVENLREVVDVKDWESMDQRLPEVMPKILDMLDRVGTKSTCFILGWVAKQQPGIVKEIAARGHEIGCHGLSHQPITRQDIDTFRAETVEARKLLQDLTGQPVLGYRAATFSVTSKTMWALRVLHDAGFTYDSSVVPVRHDRYGILGTPQGPYRWDFGDGHRMLEIPVSTLRLAGTNVPVGGGGWFRLYPLWLTRSALRHNLRQDLPAVFYVHPWEFDPGQPRFDVPWLAAFRHYVGISRASAKLERLLEGVPMGTLGDIVDHYAERELPVFHVDQFNA